MRKLILSLHTTLDSFLAGPNGEMDWIKLDDEMFDLVGTLTDEADTALYGRVTYQMMESYWPTAADQPNATKHDLEHATWYNKVAKVVLSRTLKNAEPGTTVISDNVAAEVAELKNKPGKNIIIFGSPTAAHSLMAHNLIDEYWLFVNPILLGKGIPVFANINPAIKLKLATTKPFACGIVALHYTMVQ